MGAVRRGRPARPRSPVAPVRRLPIRLGHALRGLHRRRGIGRRPGKYYRNNVGGTVALLDALVEYGVPALVFSSTAAVYGTPEAVPIAEDAPLEPINPYGRSKLTSERIIADYSAAHGLRHAVLRYFNACGADPDGETGESHVPETHLIPLALDAASGNGQLTVFGEDYPTPDGTCVRDISMSPTSPMRTSRR